LCGLRIGVPCAHQEAGPFRDTENFTECQCHEGVIGTYSIVVNVFWYSTMLACLSLFSGMEKREFADVQREIEDVLSKLKSTKDPNVRRPLLREMRHLLGEAERLLQSTT